MITKNDWNDALDAWVAEERERLGGPPSPGKVSAYLRGAMSADDAGRMRALLVYYPELTPFLGRTGRPRRSGALRVYALAATLVIATLTPLLIRERQKSTTPIVASSRYEFTSLHTRGPGIVHQLPAGAPNYLITAVPSESPDEDEYSIDITRAEEVLWSTSPVQAVDGVFVVTIPGAFLEPGMYALNISSHGRGIESYRFEVVER